MVTDQHRTTDELIKHSTLSGRISERRPEQNGLRISAEDGKRRRVPKVILTEFVMTAVMGVCPVS